MLRAVTQVLVLALTTAFSCCGVLLLTIFKIISYPCTSRKPHSPPKKILITGATSGLGAELALHYAAKYKDGVFLALTGRNKGALKEVEDKCRALGVSQFSTSSIDVKNKEGLSSWIQELNKDTPIDLVIANAGITEDTAKVRGNIEEGARQCMDVNVGGVFNTVFPALTGMRSRGSGQVCVISSVASFVPFSIFDGYSASKVAIRYWTEGLRYRLASEGIRVTCVCPGYIHGPMTEAFNGRVPLIGAVSMQYAASRIAEGLLRDEGLIVFPEGVGMLTWALSLLPWDLKDALARSRLFKELRSWANCPLLSLSLRGVSSGAAGEDTEAPKHPPPSKYHDMSAPEPAPPGQESEYPPLSSTLAQSRKRTLAMFLSTQRLTAPDFQEGARLRVTSKVLTDYRTTVHPRVIPLVNPIQHQQQQQGLLTGGPAPLLLTDASGSSSASSSSQQQQQQQANRPLISASSSSSSSSSSSAAQQQASSSSAMVPYGVAGAVESVAASLSQRTAPSGIAAGSSAEEFRRVQEVAAAAQGESRVVAMRRAPPKVPQPAWHAPWKLMRVISGHLGWVRAVAMEPGNEWFATGAGDRTVKIWDLASGRLKLTLTGHINTVRGIAVSPRNPYMFTCGEDKMIKCWDLETNKVIRSYDGHLSAVYALALHPTLDVLFSGGRDASCRVWDIRTRTQVHVLTGHENAVSSILSNSADPQVVTGGMDNTVRLWDLAAAKVRTVLTHHKKSVRCLAGHGREFAFISGAADCLKRWALPQGTLVNNYSGHTSIINAMALNQDGVLVSGGDNGSLRFWDYDTGHAFQDEQSKVQPGSLDAEAGIFAACFDLTGTRLITGEADKTIKIWREDAEATPETHPIDMDAWTDKVREMKRY